MAFVFAKFSSWLNVMFYWNVCHWTFSNQQFNPLIILYLISNYCPLKLWNRHHWKGFIKHNYSWRMWASITDNDREVRDVNILDVIKQDYSTRKADSIIFLTKLIIEYIYHHYRLISEIHLSQDFTTEHWTNILGVRVCIILPFGIRLNQKY